MITISKSGDSAIKFEFTNSQHYLYGTGEIEVLINSLLLTIDDSDMFTFKKIDGDVFISATYGEIGKTKSELETWYKENMVGSTGGGTSSGITSGEVQTMIDESISGKADSSAVTQEISAAVSGKADVTDIPSVTPYADAVKYNGTSKYMEFYHGGTGGTKVYEFDAAPFLIDGMVEDVEIKDVTLSGESVTCLVITFNTDAGKQEIDIPLTDIFDPSNYYTKTEVDSAISGKADTSAVTAVNDGLTAHTANTSIHFTTGAVQTLIDNSISGKADTSAITSSVTSASTDSQIPTAKAVYDAIPTGGTSGGKAIEAGRGISITTSETADTVSFNLPISAGTGDHSIIMGLENNIASGIRSFAGGGGSSISKVSATNDAAFAYGIGLNAKGLYSAVFGSSNSVEANGTFAAGYNNYIFGSFGVGFGRNVIGNNESETSLGKFNVSLKSSTTFGDSGNTLFSVGNGTANNARHNAFEIRQNGDIYCNNGTSDVKLQDYIQYKIVQITQSDYDLLPTKDSSTVYIIVN